MKYTVATDVSVSVMRDGELKHLGIRAGEHRPADEFERVVFEGLMRTGHATRVEPVARKRAPRKE